MSHTYSRLLYHCIFSTKDRRPQVDPTLRERLHSYIGGVLQGHGGKLLKAGGTQEHIHLLIELEPKISLADAMRLIKANSSKWIRETYPDSSCFGWQTGYAAFTVSSSSVGDVIGYIDNQEEHHRTRTFDEEFKAFLERHGLEYDNRYVLG